MYIEELGCTIRALVKGFIDDEERGCRAFSGALDVRPPYQREFIYSLDRQQKVIETIINHFPLNIMYWGTTGIPGQYSLVDGQQRTCSICNFVMNKFSIEYNGQTQYFQNLPQEIQQEILDYELLVYKCDGTDEERLAWFETINIASEPLTPQELRNAVYTGSWLADAKRYFSKTNCPAENLGQGLIKGVANRQEILEEVLKWICDAQGIKSRGKGNDAIATYMNEHKNDGNALELWNYYRDVITWVKSVFGTSFKNMNQVSWGILYNKYHDRHSLESGQILCTVGRESLASHTQAELLDAISKLQEDDEVTATKGIYEYVLSGDEKYLSIRKFPDKIKQKIYRKQGGLCKYCGKSFELNNMVADHITPWSKGGTTTEGNCQMLCVRCNLSKSDRLEIADDEIPCCNCGKGVKRGMFCQYCGTKN